jgi:hypothetical protein
VQFNEIRSVFPILGLRGLYIVTTLTVLHITVLGLSKIVYEINFLAVVVSPFFYIYYLKLNTNYFDIIVILGALAATTKKELWSRI